MVRICHVLTACQIALANIRQNQIPCTVENKTMALPQDLKDKILKSVEDGFDAQLDYTRKLVNLPSLRGQEHAIQDLVFREFQNRGYKVDRFDMDREAITAHPGGSPFSEHHSD